MSRTSESYEAEIRRLREMLQVVAGGESLRLEVSVGRDGYRCVVTAGTTSSERELAMAGVMVDALRAFGIDVALRSGGEE